MFRLVSVDLRVRSMKRWGGASTELPSAANGFENEIFKCSMQSTGSIFISSGVVGARLSGRPFHSVCQCDCGAATSRS